MANKECWLEEHPDWRGCCCVCLYHLKDCSHPHTDGGSMMLQRGWICAGFAFCEADPTAHSGWPEHGMCEMFKRVEKQKCDKCKQRFDVLLVKEFCEDCWRDLYDDAFFEAMELENELS